MIAKKLEVVSQTAELQDLLNLSSIAVENGGTPWRGKHYMALGCDLADVNRLSEALENEINLESCLILCIAEVSVTYMEVAAADSLIRWASCYNDGMFTLPVAFNKKYNTDVHEFDSVCWNRSYPMEKTSLLLRR